eukprot:TRINITY_DN2889_c0_g1_i1.p1 TRINITY_DN2889_c0_g1~~TRINITY_DN2889_c0_g1_i1.p1  ORF type:complete len:289 (-),score=24.39 TRINITY_DN2889_c0_g1_i1:117-983(-)
MTPSKSLMAVFLAVPLYSSGVEVALASGSILDLDDACRVGEECSLGLRQLRGELTDRLAVQTETDKSACLGDGESGCEYGRGCCSGLECDLYSHKCTIGYSLGQIDKDSQELVAKDRKKSTCLGDGESGCEYGRGCCSGLECDLYSHKCTIGYSLGQIDKDSQELVAKDRKKSTCLGDGESGCEYGRGCCSGLECDLYSHKCTIGYSLGQIDKDSQELVAKDRKKSTCLGDGESGCEYGRGCCSGLECDLYSHKCTIGYSLGQIDKESQKIVVTDGKRVRARASAIGN